MAKYLTYLIHILPPLHIRRLRRRHLNTTITFLRTVFLILPFRLRDSARSRLHRN